MKTYTSLYNEFIFESYNFDKSTGRAEFNYSFDGQRYFQEAVEFKYFDPGFNYDSDVLDRALRLAFYVAGTSYYKTFPTKMASFRNKKDTPSSFEIKFLNKIYHEGLSQFMFENGLSLNQMVDFNTINANEKVEPIDYDGSGIIVLQSGGKDSLLLATMLAKSGLDYDKFYIASSDSHPGVIDKLPGKLNVANRFIDRSALETAIDDGGLNGHVPVTYIVNSYALIAAVLAGKNTVVSAIGNEGEEPHEFIDQMPVSHQWSKSWQAEQLLSDYVCTMVSPNLRVGSPLRQFSELKIAKLFSGLCWDDFGHSFSSCNEFNYRQGRNNSQLGWCGNCPKCANSYLLFGPFIDPEELDSLFGDQSLIINSNLTPVFKGMLGVEGEMKPFECIGEVDELRQAYHMMIERNPSSPKFGFEVPSSDYNYNHKYPAQAWATDLIKGQIPG